MTEQLVLWPLLGPLTSVPRWSLFSVVPGMVPEMEARFTCRLFLTDVSPHLWSCTAFSQTRVSYPLLTVTVSHPYVECIWIFKCML